MNELRESIQQIVVDLNEIIPEGQLAFAPETQDKLVAAKNKVQALADRHAGNPADIVMAYRAEVEACVHEVAETFQAMCPANLTLDEELQALRLTAEHFVAVVERYNRKRARLEDIWTV